MSRWSHEEWLRDFDADELADTRKRVETDGFWRYVDSQANAYSHPGKCEIKTGLWGWRVDCSDWRHVRGDDSCMASNSGLLQCGQPALRGAPFCAFHFDRAWKAMCAFVSADRIDELVRSAEFEIKRATEDRHLALGVEEAQVRDARRLLARQPERVYFFAAGHAVKIGRSINPAKRVKTLVGTKAPDDVDLKTGVLLGTIPGGCHVESALHLRFRPHRLVGEWFALDPIREDIDYLLSQDDFADAA